MSETTNTMEQRNESQRKTIVKQVERIKELELWEKFAAHLLNNCVGLTVTPENLEKWLEDCQKRRTS
jgi:hypothetical protein